MERRLDSDLVRRLYYLNILSRTVVFLENLFAKTPEDVSEFTCVCFYLKDFVGREQNEYSEAVVASAKSLGDIANSEHKISKILLRGLVDDLKGFISCFKKRYGFLNCTYVI